MRWNPVAITDLLTESQGNSATRYYAKCPNHKAMTRPSKTNWH